MEKRWILEAKIAEVMTLTVPLKIDEKDMADFKTFLSFMILPQAVTVKVLLEVPDE